MKAAPYVGYILCPYCDHVFRGDIATDCDVYCDRVNCPKCKKQMYIDQIVNYYSQKDEDQD